MLKYIATLLSLLFSRSFGQPRRNNHHQPRHGLRRKSCGLRGCDQKEEPRLRLYTDGTMTVEKLKKEQARRFPASPAPGQQRTAGIVLPPLPGEGGYTGRYDIPPQAPEGFGAGSGMALPANPKSNEIPAGAIIYVRGGTCPEGWVISSGLNATAPSGVSACEKQ